MYRKILVALDGSATSRAALQQALGLARLTGAELCVLHVLDEGVLVWNSGELAAPDKILDALREGGERILKAARTAVDKAGCKARYRLIGSGAQPVYAVLLEEARKCRAELIILGSHGRRLLARLLLGSVADHVIHTAPVPVLLVRTRGK
ncbi:MAG: universal stress protein [Gammaproteobacteria bacterium]|nr:universal stress protein [Gammaproteobacteria bacterium]